MSKSQAQEFFKKKKDEVKSKIGKKGKEESDDKGRDTSKMPEGVCANISKRKANDPQAASSRLLRKRRKQKLKRIVDVNTDVLHSTKRWPISHPYC